MLKTPARPTVATHWGTYRVRMSEGRPAELEGFEQDPAPSPIARSMISALDDPTRIERPMIRASFFEKGYRATGAGRGAEPFVAVDWPEAITIAAGELDRVRKEHGNTAIFGGSYGWASAGRFHHAQSQIHRFLNAIGGYTRSVGNYSYAAADAIVPHVVGDRRGLVTDHTSWPVIARHARMLVLFGGLPLKNSQVSSGGIGRHILAESLEAFTASGGEIVAITPIRDDVDPGFRAGWLPIVPNTDTALMLGLAHTLWSEGLHDEAFLTRCTTGFDRFLRYLSGESDSTPKTAEWAAAICGVDAEAIRVLARKMAHQRTMIMVAWAVQRADHGEQPCWMAITLAAMLGQIGLPGGGFGIGYGSVNGIGVPTLDLSWPSLGQGTNPVDEFIPVARISDLLLKPGEPYQFNGQDRRYPDTRIVYWAGGNPFHHQQNLNRFLEAWKRPEVTIVHESWWNPLARHADIVLPVTTQLERNDIVCSSRDRILAASHRVSAPFGQARNDYDIFSALADALDAGAAFTEGRGEEDWLRSLYEKAQVRLSALGFNPPDFETFWEEGVLLFSEPEPEQQRPLLDAFRQDPIGNALPTPSGKIEIWSDRIASFGYDDCRGHPAWLEPREWLGAGKAAQFPLHLISNQPKTKLHSQYDQGSHSRAAKIRGREPVRINPTDAAVRRIGDGDIVRLFNDRGACLAAAVLSDAVRPGVLQLATGAWYDPTAPGTASLEKHGNPNVLTHDLGTSRLGQGPSAQSCLVEIERYTGELPPVTAFDPPSIVNRS
ncbi:molybdopterin-dependent oxidoreductase [Bosea sp. AS-1]|uniref:molybdopterin-dependent oxidoreductase n=1 Tax=Bosea sp. AS-1 TaxID=2015316 RepID=UPI000B78ED7C|nr:molybdopterin-dependent oxidoreductase [Bosea sp. AS-1]